jgi:hypothetical protein
MVYALYDDHVARLLDEAVYHSEHLRLGLRDYGHAQPALTSLDDPIPAATNLPKHPAPGVLLPE